MPEDSDKIALALVEDENLYRDLLRRVLNAHPKLRVVGAYADGESALAAIPALAPDVAILDIQLRTSMSGIKLGQMLRQQQPDLGIVLLSNHSNPQFLFSLPRDVSVGWSYLLKRSVSDVDALARAIEGAAAGLVVLDPQLVLDMRPKQDSLLAQLTPRQMEVLSLVAQGFTNAAIADRLVISEKSVENQLNVIYQHLEIDRRHSNLHPRVKAVLLYLEQSAINPAAFWA